MLTTQFIKNPFPSRFCEMMNTPGTHDRKVARYLIGQPNQSSIMNPGFLAVCDDCAKSIVEKLPDELLPYVNIEKALELMGEEQRDAIFDKLYPPVDVKDAFKDYLQKGLMEPEEAQALFAEYLPGFQVVNPAPPGDEIQPIPCPYCEFTARSQAGLSSHLKAKHGEQQ